MNGSRLDEAPRATSHAGEAIMALSKIHLNTACAAAAIGAVAFALTVSGAPARPKCDPDNGGIKLPPGFCAFVAADGLGTARHIAVASNGDLYVSLQRSGGRPPAGMGGGVVALHDGDGDGRFEVKEQFGEDSTTG